MQQKCGGGLIIFRHVEKSFLHNDNQLLLQAMNVKKKLMTHSSCFYKEKNRRGFLKILFNVSGYYDIYRLTSSSFKN